MDFLYFDHNYEKSSAIACTKIGSDIRVYSSPSPWDIYNNRLLRFLCHAHLSSNINDRFSLPFRSIWNKELTKMIKNRECCLIVSSHYFELANSGLVNYFHQKGGFVVFEFTDKYEFFRSHYKHFPSAEQLKKDYDLIITYNVHDVKEYGFTLCRPRFRDYSIIVEDNTLHSSDVFFVGNNKGRLSKIIEIFEFCTDNGLDCEFYINNVEKIEQKYTDSIHYNELLSYNEVLKKVKKSRCVLNLVQHNGEGITLRDYEALGMGKYLLTNNYAIKETELFDKQQVIWIDDLKERFKEIKNGMLPGYRKFDQYNYEQWFIWLSNELLSSNKLN